MLSNVIIYWLIAQLLGIIGLPAAHGLLALAGLLIAAFARAVDR
jgi:hypothetical protein